MEAISFLWNEIILRPMLNSLVVLYGLLFSNFGLSIILFTIVMRIATLPLTMRQLRQTKAMSSLQPKLKEIQQRYAKDKQRISQETMRLYKEHGVNPLGCLGPMLIQFPIWIGLYQSIIRLIPNTPESLAGLAQHLYSWLPLVSEAVPVNSSFLWMDLAGSAQADRIPFLLPILVGGSMWVQQKMMTMPTTDPRQAQTNSMMLWMMPLMFGFLTLQFPIGLALYWMVSNIIGIVVQYFVTGWGSLLKSGRVQEALATAPAPNPPAEETVSDGDNRGDGKDSGRGDRDRAKGARRKARRGRGRRR